MVEPMLKSRPMCKTESGLHQGHGHLGGQTHATPDWPPGDVAADAVLYGLDGIRSTGDSLVNAGHWVMRGRPTV